jgi:hypothetical protein
VLKVIVIGVPRSGTSLVASIVNELGFTIESRPPTECEPGGQWGGVDILDVVSSGRFTAKKAKKYLTRYDPMGIKVHGFDNREIERYVLGSYEFKVILTNRSKESVLRSLIRKRLVENKSLSKMNAEKFAARRFHAANLKVLRFIQECKKAGKKILSVDLKKVIDTPEPQIIRIASFLKVDDRKRILSSIGLINQDYWHFR